MPHHITGFFCCQWNHILSNWKWREVELKNVPTASASEEQRDSVVENVGIEGLGIVKKCLQHGNVYGEDWDLRFDNLNKNYCSCVPLVRGVGNTVNPDILVALFIHFLMWKGSGKLSPDT